MLKAVVEQMNTFGDSRLSRGSFGEGSGVESASGYIDGDICFTCDQQGFVTVGLGRSVGVDCGWGRSAAAVAAGENVEVEILGFEQASKGDYKWGFAGASGGDASDADDGPGEALYAFETETQASRAKSNAYRVERDEG